MRHKIRWTSQKIRNRISILEKQIYKQIEELPPFRFKYLSDSDNQIPIQPDFDDSTWTIIQPYDYWVNPRTNFVLRTKFTIPTGFSSNFHNSEDRVQIALYLPIGDAGDFSHPEALVYIDGYPIAGCDRHHQEIILAEGMVDEIEHTLVLHGWSGIGGATVGDLTDRLKMNPCEIVLIDQPTRDFLALVRVSLGVVEQLDEDNPAKHSLLTTLDESFQILDLRTQIDDKRFYNSIPDALELLRLGIQKSGPPLGVSISAIGHAHIDVAWLWTLSQTRQKAGRTFYNILRLMSLFPNFHFVQSQPQLYEFVRQDFPDLFLKIKEKVQEGQWELIGGMWVEADCNLTGPESLVRQFLLGRTFYKDHFGSGVDSPVLWLPDVFGYAWNLPQLIKEAGLEYFFTIKIGWSQYNRLPYDSFWWQGLDGTKVLTHFSTTKDPDSPFAATYNSVGTPAEVIGTWKNFQQKDYGTPGSFPPMLMSYGYGDGGGGPTQEMLENIREMASFPSTPQIEMEKVGKFFTKLEICSANLPVWNGELYLEYHRGTYTTQARNKQANRRSEFLLHDAEFLATYASLLFPEYHYPGEKLNEAWKLVCLNQFHDIIPGSSIGPVYVESLKQYDEIKNIAEVVKNDALEVIQGYLDRGSLLVNPTSFQRNAIVEIVDQQPFPKTLEPFSIQVVPEVVQDQSSRYIDNQITSSISVSTKHLENGMVRIEFNENGDLIRIFDKRENREILVKNAIGNQFLAFEDIPLSWDAWDIDIYYDDKVWLAKPAKSIKIIEENEYRVALQVERKILNSDYTQVISIDYNSPRIDFITHINWCERQTLLKVAFPVDILSPLATYEIQWGNVERPTHRNTSWDWARFETAAQKWVDLSEGGYGVSLLNDCKYGHDIHNNVIRLTLLRGTTAPDPTADIGDHTFTYSLLPHQGNWGKETVREAYALNNPLIVFSPDTPTQNINPSSKKSRKDIQHLPSLASVNRDYIIIETIKRAEDGNGIIIRLYEYQRMRGDFVLSLSFPVAKAWRTNILEENQEEIFTDNNTVSFSIKPFQILTFRLIPELEVQQ